MQKKILKLPHYSCNGNDILFLDKKVCHISSEAADLFQTLNYQLNDIRGVPPNILTELLQTQSIKLCDIPEKQNSAPLILVFSPHLDDAVFSMGGFLTQLSFKYRIHILTLFSVDPHSVYKTLRFDFSRLQEIRFAEEAAAASLIQATTSQLGWNDALLRQYQDIKEPININEPNERYIKGIIRNIPQNPSFIFCPLGLLHVDHRLTRILVDCIRKKYISHIPIAYYEDLPYACDNFCEPENLMPIHSCLGEFELNQKKTMVKLYMTQIAPGVVSKIMKYRKGKECFWTYNRESARILDDVFQ